MSAEFEYAMQQKKNGNVDEAKFYFADRFWWKKIGNTHKLAFRLDHFTGCRFGLFVYSTKETGGKAGFLNFVYKER